MRAWRFSSLALVGIVVSCGGEDFTAQPATTSSTGGTGSAGAGVGGSSGDGGSTVMCRPGEMEDCYTGPPETEGVGVCKKGSRICNAEGTVWGECQGETLPAPTDDCATVLDEDCNGATNDGCPCEPGSSAECYSGPPGTEGVGLCSPGTHVCNPDGLSYGPCMREVLPAMEICFNGTDEDCDGASCAQPLWVLRKGDSDVQKAYSVAVDGSGNVYVVGSFDSQIDWGGGTISSAGSLDVFVVKLTAQGNHVWTKQFGGTGNQEALDVAIAGNDVVVVGTFYTGITLAVAHTAVGTEKAGFIAKLSGTNGNPIWSSMVDLSSTSTDITDVAVDGFGDVVAVGSAVDAALGEQVVVRKYSSVGALSFSKVWGNAGPQRALDVAVDPSNSILVAGEFDGIIDFGNNQAIASGSGTNAWVAKLDVTGAHVWSKSLGDVTSTQSARAVAVDPQDSSVVVGGFNYGTMTCGGGNLATAGGSDAFVCRLASNGNHVWSKSFGTAADQQAVQSIAIDAKGDVVLLGHYGGTIDFGGGSLQASVGMLWDPFLVKLDASGNHKFSRGFVSSAATAESIGGVAATSSLVVLAVGQAGVIDYGTGLLPGPGTYDALVAAYAP